MLSAGSCETWLTLEELSRVTKYGEASISAQLRHLRKPCYGGFVVEKRRREVAEVICRVEHGPVWEYRLTRGVRKFPFTTLAATSGSGGALAGATTPGSRPHRDTDREVR
jgi:hypothetical protein